MSAAEDTDHEALSLLDRPLPPAFVRWTVTIAPGTSHAYVASEWQGAVVEVVAGEVTLVGCAGGGGLRLGRGAVLWLDGVPLAALLNAGAGPAVLVAVTRRRGSAGVGRPSTDG